MTLTPPADTPEYAHGIWAAALLAALKQPNIMEAFRKDTGITYYPPRNPIEAMIDEASGLGESVATAYCNWFNENVWGAWDGPSISKAEEPGQAGR